MVRDKTEMFRTSRLDMNSRFEDITVRYKTRSSQSGINRDFKDITVRDKLRTLIR